MNAEITIDNAGRVVIPKAIRDGLRLSPGDALELEPFEDHMVLRPVRPQTPMVRKRGIWVYQPENILSSDALLDAIDAMRDERIRDLS
jgi:AbrB family looped-hinge helix DNA binding protein